MSMADLGGEEDEAEGAPDTSGFLADRVARAKVYLTTKKGSGDLGTRNLVGLLTDELKDEVRAAEHNFSMRVIARERLRAWLMEEVIKECKERGIYKKVGPGRLIEICAYVRKCKSMYAAIRNEVDNWLMKFKLLHAHIPELTEEPTDKKNRLDEFWSVFHDRARVLEAETSGKAERSRPKYGMQWRHEAGQSLWQITDPLPGTLAHGLRVNEAQSPTHGQMGARSVSSLSLIKPVRSSSKGSLSDKPGSGRQRVQLPPVTSQRHRYLKECESSRKIPTPLPFVTGHSSKFNAEGRNLVDLELMAMAEMLLEMKKVQDVNLQDNSLLTDKALTPFLARLLEEPIASTLQRLSLARCLRAGPGCHQATLNVLKASDNLQHLNLSQVNLAARLQLPICQAIGEHPQLKTVNLSETGIGGTLTASQCLSGLLGSSSVHTLDLSWNSFKGDVFGNLGEHMRTNKVLKKFRIANCSATADEAVPPLSRFLEHLAYNTGLTHLDLSMNRCDFRTGLVLEDSLVNHQSLKELILSDNPLATMGVRSLIRLLSHEENALTYFEIDNCFSGDVNDAGGEVSMIFSYTNPGGRYKLDLWRPYHRSLLRMLYKRAERFNVSFQDAFLNLQYNQGLKVCKYEHPSKDPAGIYQVEDKGTLQATFNVEKAMENGIKNIKDDDYNGFLAVHYELMRFRPGFKKVIPLFARWKDLDGRPDAQRCFVNALAKDFNISLPYLEFMAKASPMFLNETMWRLMPCIPLDRMTQYVSIQIFPRLSDYILIAAKMQQLFDFNLQNPSGHYKLDLGNCCEYTIAERLLLLDRWEAAVDKRNARFDVSSRGNGSHIRNEYYQGRTLSLNYASVAEWKLAENGEFEFDYVSNLRPPKGAGVLSDALWEHVLTELYMSSCSNQDKIIVLRTISDNFYITSKHMRMLIGFFKDPADRSEVFIAFFIRIVDMWNAKIWRVRFESLEEIVRLQNRLGYASFFPFLQPENAKFDLDLSVWDQRLCASMFVALCYKESPLNLHDFGWKHADGSQDAMGMGVPRSWAEFKTIPQEGVFSATYMCAPEKRNFEFRKQLAEIYGFFSTECKEDEVMWWTGLLEPPTDVCDLLEFLIGRYDNMTKPFKDIDGEGGNGQITLKEFQEGIDTIGCHKFDGPDKVERITAVFRYLDPGGEGSVSQDEWDMLNQLWSEFDLSIREFVYFLVLVNGPDLTVAWKMLDSSGDGSLSEEEWVEAVTEIGYFGPSKVVFALLDSTDDGDISWEEFAILEKYIPDKFKNAPPDKEPTKKRKLDRRSSSKRLSSKQNTVTLDEVDEEAEEN